MTIHIQHRKSKLFYHRVSGWVRTRNEATIFPSPLNALNFASEHILDDTEVVFFIEPALANSNPASDARATAS